MFINRITKVVPSSRGASVASLEGCGRGARAVALRGPLRGHLRVTEMTLEHSASVAVMHRLPPQTRSLDRPPACQATGWTRTNRAASTPPGSSNYFLARFFFAGAFRLLG